MLKEKIGTTKKNILLIGIILTAAILIWVFLSNSQPGLYGKIFSIGSSVCHQIPSHSFTAGEVQFPVCARCAGLYFGSFIGLVYAFFSGRKKGIPSKGFLILLGVLFLLWVGDGINSFISDFIRRPFLYQTSNLSRLITGYGMGLVMSTALATLFNQTVWLRGENDPILDRVDQIIQYVVLCAFSSIFLFTGQPILLLAAGYITIITVLVIISLLYTVFWILTFKKENQFTNWKNLTVVLLAGFTTAVAQITLLVALRNRML